MASMGPQSTTVPTVEIPGIETPKTWGYRIKHGGLLRYCTSLALLLVAMCALAFLWRADSFATLLANVISEIFHQGIVYCLLALGAALVIATSEIDLSSLGVATFSGVIFALVSSEISGPIARNVLSALCVLLFSVGSGALVSYCVTRLHAPPLIFTWALGSIYVLAAIVITPLASTNVEHTVAEIGLRWRIPSSAWRIGGGAFDSCIAVVLFGMVFVSGINLPSKAAAVGGNADSARYAGIAKTSVLAQCFIANSLLAALAGVIQSLDYGAATTRDLDVNINGLIPVAIALIGGTSLGGGYLSLWSVTFAAFFWSAASLLGPLLPNHVRFLGIFRAAEAELGQGLFYLVFLIVALVFGKALSPPASKIYASKESA
jgi:ribose/xylose/arabinose/galactoside ABC-type transport system permease subunit